MDKAGLTSVIEKLPNGLGTHVGREVYLDGMLFSGGEIQRLMLARALYKDARSCCWTNRRRPLTPLPKTIST